MTDKRLVAVIIWKQGEQPDAGYARQVLRVAAPEALGPAGGDGEPNVRVPVRMLAGPGDWPEDFWIVALQALRYPTDYSDPARYDLSGWQGTDARNGARLFVASVYEKPVTEGQPAVLTVVPTPQPPAAPPPPPARPPLPPGPGYPPGSEAVPPAGPPAPPAYGAAPGYGGPPGTAPTPGYGTPPGTNPPPPAYGGPGMTPGYGVQSTTPGYGTSPPAPPGYSPAGGGAPGPSGTLADQPAYFPTAPAALPRSDAYPGYTGIAGEDVNDPNRGFYAGFGPRLMAGVVDAIISGILLIIPLLCTVAFSSTQPADTSAETNRTGLLLFCGFSCLSAGLLALYHGGFWLWRGQTPGKMLAGIKVVGADGHPPHVGQMLLRVLGYVMSTALLGLGFLLISFDERKQGLADRVAGTYVVPVKPPARPRPPQLPGYPPAPPVAAPPPDASGSGAGAPTAAVAAPVAMMAPAEAPARPPASGMTPTGVQWGPPPGTPSMPDAAPALAGPEEARTLAPTAGPAADPTATEAFRQGLDRLAEGVREPGGQRPLLIVEPEAGQAATRAFQAAVDAAPQQAVYRYYLGVARRYGEGYTAAQPEFVQAAQMDPTLWEARLQAYFGSRWHDAFAYPQWSPRATGLAPILAALRPPRPGTRLVLVREGGAKTVAALCVTARSAWHRLPTAEMPARIELVAARSPYGTAIAFYTVVRDDASDPYRGETFLNPAEALTEDGDATQLGQNLVLQLARQGHTYLIFVDETGAVLLNRRLVFDAATQANLAQVAQEVQALAAGAPLPADRFAQAAQWHMDQYPLDRVVI